MKNKTSELGTRQKKWASFRFAVVGPLLASPPEGSNTLKSSLEALSKRQWKHPITGNPVYFGVSTIERWFYRAKKSNNPVEDLRTKRRLDASKSRRISSQLHQMIKQQYNEHPSWSYQLHTDNLLASAKTLATPPEVPSYNTIRRHMKANGFYKRRRAVSRHTDGARRAQQRLEQREIRSFEMDYVHSLWHLDFHHGSRKIVDASGEWRKPLLLCVLDDRSRLVCHAQWYFDETAESLTHGFKQALQKRGLPRSLMSDNGSAMMSMEFTQGLERLSILHEPTLPYSPYQNAKQEVLWAQVEGRLMAMLEGESELTLELLNEATIAWVEFEYHRKMHAEINSTPLDRYLNDKSVARDCPSSETLRQAFSLQTQRRQRQSDGTISLEGKRFEVPSRYRHLEYIHVRYARWDLSNVLLIDANTDKVIDALFPQDKSKNAQGMRRRFEKPSQISETSLQSSSGIAPLLKNLMMEYAATGMPPAYIPTRKDNE